jgi:hypothetical protein
MAKDKDKNKKQRFIFSKFYKICVFILIFLAFVVSPIYPEMILRMLIGIILAIGIFFGYAPDEVHCEYVYQYIKIEIKILDIIDWSWALGCPSRLFAMLVSIGCYGGAVLLGFKTKII